VGLTSEGTGLRAGVVVLNLLREFVSRERFADSSGAESDGVVVSGQIAALFVVVVLNELAEPLSVVFE